MRQPTADSEFIAAQYTALLQSHCAIAESYYYLGRLDDALKLLDAGLQIIAQHEVLPSDRAVLLLQRGKLKVTTIYLATGEVEATLATQSQPRRIAESSHGRRQIG